MPKNKIISSQIFTTGTKFVVTDDSKDGTFGPGTTGFISHVKGPDRDYPNVVFLRVTLNRLGKRGKERITIGELSTPVFDIKSKNLVEFLPDEQRKHYVHIEPVERDITDVLRMSSIDFLTWANSYVRFLYKLNGALRHITIWPNGAKKLTNYFLNVTNYFDEDPEYIKESYASIEVRKSFVEEARLLETMLTPYYLTYMCRVSQIEENAIKYIEKLHTRKKPISPKTVLTATLRSFLNKSKDLATLDFERSKLLAGKSGATKKMNSISEKTTIFSNN